MTYDFPLDFELFSIITSSASVAGPVKKLIAKLQLLSFASSACIPDLFPSHYHLFRSMQNALTGMLHIRTGETKLTLFILVRQAGAVIIGWNPQFARKIEKCYSSRYCPSEIWNLFIILMYTYTVVGKRAMKLSEYIS